MAKAKGKFVHLDILKADYKRLERMRSLGESLYATVNRLLDKVEREATR